MTTGRINQVAGSEGRAAAAGGRGGGGGGANARAHERTNARAHERTKRARSLTLSLSLSLSLSPAATVSAGPAYQDGLLVCIYTERSRAAGDTRGPAAPQSAHAVAVLRCREVGRFARPRRHGCLRRLARSLALSPRGSINMRSGAVGPGPRQTLVLSGSSCVLPVFAVALGRGGPGGGESRSR